MNKLVPLLLSVPLAACQSVVPDADTTADLDGVWKGVFSNPDEHVALQGHMLDGLLLSFDLDRPRAHSAEVVLDDGELAGLFARRGPAGERDQDYTVLGVAGAYDRLEADLLGEDHAARLSLFYSGEQSFQGASRFAAEGLYVYYGPDIEVSLGIDPYGVIEGYDDAGCGYFGRLTVPDLDRNIYAVSLDIEGCALAGDYGYGIGSLEYDAQGYAELVLPIWFDQQDRVEAWHLQRQ